MRTRINLLVILLVVFLLSAVIQQVLEVAKAEPLDTYHSGWHLIRETANEDGANFAAVYSLAAGEGNFANKDSSSVADGGPFRIPTARSSNLGEGHSPGSKWMLAFCGEARNGADDTFSYNVVGWSKDNGMLHNICEGAGTLGTQTVEVYPDDDATAIGGTVSITAVTYDHTAGDEEKYFSKTDVGLGVVAGMMAYITGTNITSGYYEVLVVTDDDNISVNVTATDDNTDSTVDIAIAYWADTLANDEDTKWPKQQGNLTGTAVYNSTDNEVALLVIETMGLEWIQVVVYDADGATAEQAGNVTVYGRRY